MSNKTANRTTATYSKIFFLIFTSIRMGLGLVTHLPPPLRVLLLYCLSIHPTPLASDSNIDLLHSGIMKLLALEIRVIEHSLMEIFASELREATFT